jgi:regulator of cell morphogenesis and NO signaling
MLLHTTIEQLVRSNYVYAMALRHLGIRFFEHPHTTVAELCQRHSWNEQHISSFFLAYHKLFPKLPIQEAKSCSIEFLLDYLRHAHRLFIRERLPFMAELIEALPVLPSYKDLIEDLKVLFPLFTEEFVLHIHEEEDHFFYYIDLLLQARASSALSPELVLKMQQTHVGSFAIDHDTHDDEMRGIRRLTHNYHIPDKAPTDLVVVLSALADFDRELHLHARLENEVLFPKALRLEQEIKRRYLPLIFSSN